MLAPVLGGVLLLLTSWRGIFWGLTACGALALLGWCALRETCGARTGGSVWTTLGRVGHVLGHKGFRSLLLVFSAGSMPFMAYLATSAYIYISIFQVTPLHYGYYFAANAAVSVLGPLLYIRFLRDLPRRGFIAFCFAATGVFGVLLTLFGGRAPFALALLFAPINVFASAFRPASTMLLMNQMDTDTGTVASLVGSVALLFGGLSMLLCSLPWTNFILATGGMAVLVGFACAAAWLRLDRRASNDLKGQPSRTF
jgi:DHA1 family bicyclomycin/chloramphenicol resistance-like MFS transporter